MTDSEKEYLDVIRQVTDDGRVSPAEDADAAVTLEPSASSATNAGSTRATGTHSVSVVIPAFNEEANIADLIQQIMDEPWGGDLILQEVIVVDDCSDDATLEIVQGLVRKYENIREIHHEHRKGKNAGLRGGISASRGDIVAFVDADVRLGLCCLTRTVRLLVENRELAAASCVTAPLPARSWRERASRYQSLVVMELGRAGYGSLSRIYAVRAAVLDGFQLPDTPPDDAYLVRWLLNRGYECGVNTQATVYIRPAVGLRDFAKQTIRSWRVTEALDRVLPETAVPPAYPRRGILRCIIRASVQDPLGFSLYSAWRALITMTPSRWWMPMVVYSKFDTSRSTKDLNA